MSGVILRGNLIGPGLRDTFDQLQSYQSDYADIKYLRSWLV